METSTKIRRALRRYVDHPAWTLMRIVGRFDLARELAGFRTGHATHATHSESSALVEVDTERALEDLAKDGVALGLHLSSGAVSSIVDYAESATCYADRDRSRPIINRDLSLDCRAIIATYLDAKEECAAIAQLARDPTLLEISTRYLRGTPHLRATVLWWSLPVEASERERSLAAQMFHFDLDDYRFLKFFFYLTDVDNRAGPHVCVRGTHRRKALRHQMRLRRYADTEIERTYGRGAVLEICGPAGMGFVEDTRCFHKGCPPLDDRRLLLQLEYGRHDYGTPDH